MGAFARLVFGLIAAITLAACPTVPSGGDAGSDRDGGAIGASARVALPYEPLEISDVTFESFRITVTELRLVSDRGPLLDPALSPAGPIDLVSTNELRFESIPPASYSAAVLVLDGGAAVLDIVAEDAMLGRVHLRYGTRVEWMARCASAVPVNVGQELDLGIEAELGTAWETLRSADLPDPTADTIELDETTAPEVVSAFVAELARGLTAQCGAGASP